MARRKSKIEQTQGCVRLAVVGIALLLILGVAYWLLFAPKKAKVEVTVDDGINLTPEQIEAVKNIGEWELLSVSDEELIDTVSKGFFKDDKLARIYYGTLRFGINLEDVSDGWMQQKGDTVVVKLPPVKLLDRDFIDEARTKSFYETGRWTGEDRQALYTRAYNKMLAHCVTEKNIKEAEENAVKQMKKIMNGMGFDNVEVSVNYEK